MISVNAFCYTRYTACKKNRWLAARSFLILRNYKLKDSDVWLIYFYFRLDLELQLR